MGITHALLSTLFRFASFLIVVCLHYLFGNILAYSLNMSWKQYDGTYVYWMSDDPAGIIVIVVVHVQCQANYNIIIYQGGVHTERFATCTCEPLVATMVRAHIWPSSPQDVHNFDLLDWAEALLSECQVSVEGLCKAIQFRCQHLVI